MCVSDVVWPVRPCHMVYAFHSETDIVIQEIATPSLERSTGCYCRRKELIYQPIYLMTLVLTRDDVRDFMSHRTEYSKANKFKDLVVKIYI